MTSAAQSSHLSLIHLAFPFQTFSPLPLGKNVLCHLSQPGIQLTSQHLAKYHKPQYVLTHVVPSIVVLHVLSQFGNICQLECSEAVKRVHDNLWDVCGTNTKVLEATIGRLNSLKVLR